MRTETQAITPTQVRPPDLPGRSRRSWLWPGIGVAVFGLAAGLALGITTYQDSQREIATFARTLLPGTAIVQVDEPGAQVVYYEGGRSVSIDSLLVAVTDPDGGAVVVAPYVGELIYETTGLTQGRAIASFDAERIGGYDVEVSGIDIGQVTIGESVARLALPGVLAGLAIAGLSLVAGFSLWLYSILRR